MRTTTARRLDHWVDLVRDLLVRPDAELPHLWIRDELCATFGSNGGWCWVEADFSCGFEMHEQPPGWPTAEEDALWQGRMMAEHPLMQWFLTTGSITAMTVGRVPSAIGSRWGREVLVEFLRPVGIDQQLVIPYDATGPRMRAFTMATSGADFSDEQLQLAQQIQSMLILLARQSHVLTPQLRGAVTEADGCGLTGRERAVLGLLAEGLTSTAIARRLGCSPGTVRKHLENAYRKLGVHDRLLAVRRAQEIGVLGLTEGRRGSPSG